MSSINDSIDEFSRSLCKVDSCYELLIGFIKLFEFWIIMLSSPTYLTSSPCPIFKKTSSNVVIPTPYDRTPNAYKLESNSLKNSLKIGELSVGS